MSLSILTNLHLDSWLTACGVIFLLSSCLYYVKTYGRPSLPPGPRPLPFLGNILDLPQVRPWETYSRWADEFGDIIHFRTNGRSTIVLNSFDAISELFESRSHIYSGRPYMTMFNELMDFGGTGFLPYGTVWRKHRRFYHQHMHNTALRESHPAVLTATRNLLRLLVVNPSDHQKHIRHLSGGIIMSTAYGHDIASENDEYIALAEKHSVFLAKAFRPGAFLVDAFPILKYLPEWCPGAGFHKFAKVARRNVQHTREVPFNDLKARIAAGTARPCFVVKSLNALGTLGDSDNLNEDVDTIKRVAAGMLGPGSDTTTSTLGWFLLAMIFFPDVQKKAQAEMDSVIGRERLPNFSDRPHLPYLDCLIKETFRWFPVAPLGLPRVTTEDDVYRGYRIPSGSLVLPNSWRLLNDPRVYSDPRRFWPERFLPDQKGNTPRDPTIGGVFGYGRRICPGRNLADATVWIAITSILFSFNVVEVPDENGNKLDRITAMDPLPGALSGPRPFKCAFLPRLHEIESLIMADHET